MAVFDPTDPRHLSPDQRLDQVAAILATGLRRALAVRVASGILVQQIPPESEQNGLDVPPQKSVHVARPVNATGEQGRS